MKSELQQTLIKKYPEFFQSDLKIYTGEKPMIEEIGELLEQKEIVIPIQFGITCEDGWYMLLDRLMGQIKNHIENETRNRIRKKQEPLIFEISQIKEKFGGLSFYYHGGDEAIRGMVFLAESLSYKICEKCGTTINVGQTESWIYTCCENCYNKNERMSSLPWKLNTR